MNIALGYDNGVGRQAALERAVAAGATGSESRPRTAGSAVYMRDPLGNSVEMLVFCHGDTRRRLGLQLDPYFRPGVVGLALII